MSVRASNLTIPNVLTGPRLASVPLLLLLAWKGEARLYLNCLGVSLATDLGASVHRVLKTRTGLNAALAMWPDSDPIEPQLNKIEAPTLVVWGAQDKLVPLAAGRKFKELIRSSRLVVFHPGGHVPHEEMPERFVSEISEFLR